MNWDDNNPLRYKATDYRRRVIHRNEDGHLATGLDSFRRRRECKRMMTSEEVEEYNRTNEDGMYFEPGNHYKKDIIRYIYIGEDRVFSSDEYKYRFQDDEIYSQWGLFTVRAEY